MFEYQNWRIFMATGVRAPGRCQRSRAAGRGGDDRTGCAEGGAAALRDREEERRRGGFVDLWHRL